MSGWGLMGHLRRGTALARSPSGSRPFVFRQQAVACARILPARPPRAGAAHSVSFTMINDRGGAADQGEGHETTHRSGFVSRGKLARGRRRGGAAAGNAPHARTKSARRRSRENAVQHAVRRADLPAKGGRRHPWRGRGGQQARLAIEHRRGRFGRQSRHLRAHGRRPACLDRHRRTQGARPPNSAGRRGSSKRPCKGASLISRRSTTSSPRAAAFH